MNDNKELKKTIALISLGTVVLGAVLILIFYLVGAYQPSVLLGTICGCILAILNIVLLMLFLQKAVHSDGYTKAIVGVSYLLRMLLLIGGALCAILLLKANPLSVIIPLIFPRIVMAILQLSGQYPVKNRANTDEDKKHER